MTVRRRGQCVWAQLMTLCLSLGSLRTPCDRVGFDFLLLGAPSAVSYPSVLLWNFFAAGLDVTSPVDLALSDLQRASLAFWPWRTRDLLRGARSRLPAVASRSSRV